MATIDYEEMRRKGLSGVSRLGTNYVRSGRSETFIAPNTSFANPSQLPLVSADDAMRVVDVARGGSAPVMDRPFRANLASANVTSTPDYEAMRTRARTFGSSVAARQERAAITARQNELVARGLSEAAARTKADQEHQRALELKRAGPEVTAAASERRTAATIKAQSERDRLNREAASARLDTEIQARRQLAIEKGEVVDSPAYKQKESDELAQIQKRAEAEGNKAMAVEAYKRRLEMGVSEVTEKEVTKTDKAGNPLAGRETRTVTGEVPPPPTMGEKAPVAGDTDGNGIAQADEEAMAWAKTNAQSNPIAADAIKKRLKAKYPDIYGKE